MSARGTVTALFVGALTALLAGCGGAAERERESGSEARESGSEARESGSGALEQPSAPRASPGVDPVVLVHGLGGSPADWDTFRGWFTRDGYADGHTVAVDVSTQQHNAGGARVIADAVGRLKKETGAGKVDLVAFSMGNLSARHYLAHLDGTAHVREFAGIAGPNRGMDTQLTEGCGPDAGTDACEMARGSDFLRALNSGDPTPGSVRYATWRSEGDEIVPAATTPLKGATNHRVPGRLGHVELIGDERVYRSVRAFLDGR